MISDVGTSANLDVGTGANQLVQLDANARLPAVDGSQLTNISSGTSGSNTPYFSGQKANDSDVARNVVTTIGGFTDNEIDSDNAFNGQTFTVPSGKAGVYFFSASVSNDFQSIGNDGERVHLTFQKNGSDSGMPRSTFIKSGSVDDIQIFITHATALLNLAVGDAITIAVLMNDASGGNAKVNTNSFFSGFKLM